LLQLRDVISTWQLQMKAAAEELLASEHSNDVQLRWSGMTVA
jgi:hypothetical protein